MNNQRLVLASALLMAATLGCAKESSPPQADTQADAAAILAVRDREAALLAAGQTDSLLATVYSDDITFLPPNEPMVQGREAAKAWAGAMLAQVTMTARYESLQQPVVTGDLAVDTYTATLTLTPKAGGAPMEEQIKGIHVLKRQADGTWRIVLDTWNTNAPAPPPPPAAGKK